MTALPQFARFWMVRHERQKFYRYSTRAEALFYAQHVADFLDSPFLILEAVEIIRPGTDQKGLEL